MIDYLKAVYIDVYNHFDFDLDSNELISHIFIINFFYTTSYFKQWKSKIILKWTYFYNIIKKHYQVDNDNVYIMIIFKMSGQIVCIHLLLSDYVIIADPVWKLGKTHR